jgi:hypothetical protein
VAASASASASAIAVTDSPRIDFSGPGRLITIMIDITNIIDGVSQLCTIIESTRNESQRYIHRVIWILPHTHYLDLHSCLGIIATALYQLGEGPRGFFDI